jgi:hypothetical protein
MFHPDVRFREWAEEREGVRYLCLKLDTLAGPLTGRLRQREGWPGGGFVLSPVDDMREDTERAWNNTRVFIETLKRSWA